MRVALGDIHGLGTAAGCNIITGTGCPGTYGSPDCPGGSSGWCYILGNGLDTMIMGNQCWPCHNVCPSGTYWDSTNLKCSANPQTTEPGSVPGVTDPGSDPGSSDTPSGCPGYCSWLPFASMVADCNPCTGNAGGISITEIGLAAVVMLGLFMLVKK